MRNGLITALVLTGFLLGTVTFATAGQVTWTILESANALGRGPGPDGVIGVPGCGDAEGDDTTTGEWNTCNFDLTNDCMNTGSPTNGTYSYSATEYALPKSCYGGSNNGQPCNDDTECPDGSCADCAKNAGWDLVLYVGDSGSNGGNGTMTMCQDAGSGGATITSMKTGMSSPDPLAGPVCVNLGSGGPFTTDGCGVDVLFNYTVNTVTKAFNCTFRVGSMDGLTSQARVIAIDDATPPATCGYSAADILCLQAEAPPEATYLLIGCSGATLGTMDQMCLSGATTQSKVVYWTADDASDCTSACGGGGCMAGTAEGVK